MKKFSYQPTKKLLEIFTEHCRLTIDQYEVLGEEFMNLETEYQDSVPQADIEKHQEKMRIIFDFLLETKVITLKEHLALNNMVDDMEDQATQMAVEAAAAGVIL